MPVSLEQLRGSGVEQSLVDKRGVVDEKSGTVKDLPVSQVNTVVESVFRGETENKGEEKASQIEYVPSPEGSGLPTPPVESDEEKKAKIEMAATDAVNGNLDNQITSSSPTKENNNVETMRTTAEVVEVPLTAEIEPAPTDEQSDKVVAEVGEALAENEEHAEVRQEEMELPEKVNGEDEPQAQEEPIETEVIEPEVTAPQAETTVNENEMPEPELPWLQMEHKANDEQVISEETRMDRSEAVEIIAETPEAMDERVAEPEQIGQDERLAQEIEPASEKQSMLTRFELLRKLDNVDDGLKVVNHKLEELVA